MAPVTHLLASWIIAVKTTDNPRDCRLVTLAGLLPDADGLGLIVDLVNQAVAGKEGNFYWYQRYHHYLLHGALGGLLIAAVMAGFARRRWRVALLALLVFHLHLLCDFFGSRGPDPVDLWPIFYYGPFNRDPMWIWKGQWRLDGWLNRGITVSLFLWSLWLATSLGQSILGFFNRRADGVVVGVLKHWRQRWFGGLPNFTDFDR